MFNTAFFLHSFVSSCSGHLEHGRLVRRLAVGRGVAGQVAAERRAAAELVRRGERGAERDCAALGEAADHHAVRRDAVLPLLLRHEVLSWSSSSLTSMYFNIHNIFLLSNSNTTFWVS